MVKEEDSRSEGCEFEFRARYWMDFFTIICCKICITCLKRQKINEKEAEDGPFLKVVCFAGRINFSPKMSAKRLCDLLRVDVTNKMYNT